MFPWIQTGEVNQVNHPTSAVLSFITPDGGPMVDDLGDFPLLITCEEVRYDAKWKKKTTEKG
jgi:hypothetical protein